MKLRELAAKDAGAMLEWMHDSDVVAKMGTNFQNKTISDCYSFINNASKDSNNIHRAIVNEKDEYLGTVSLKNIDRKEKIAEFAIVVCKKSMGTGVAAWAMQEIIHFGRKELDLQRIVWCVRKDNIRAKKFYIKNGYQETQNLPQYLCDTYNNSLDLIWFEWRE